MAGLPGGGKKRVSWARSWILSLTSYVHSPNIFGTKPAVQRKMRFTDGCYGHIQISFGVAPAVASFSVGLRTPVDHLLLTFFVLCGLTRLARFNVTVQTLPKDGSGKSKYFEGTPIPTTICIEGLMLAIWTWNGWVLDNVPGGIWGQGTIWEWHPIALVWVLHGCAMGSKTIHIP